VKKSAGTPARTRRPLCVVGMGGSAGALDAFELYYRATPPDLRAACVLVPHLDPTHKGIMPEILSLLRTRTGHDFALYKRTTVYRRIQRRMGLHRLASLSQYTRRLQESPHEIDLLFKELLIGVTGFFRDPELFESLRARILTLLPGVADRQGFYRAWVTGCSTG
jgi:hypothetical protein